MRPLRVQLYGRAEAFRKTDIGLLHYLIQARFYLAIKDNLAVLQLQRGAAHIVRRLPGTLRDTHFDAVVYLSGHFHNPLFA